jgi:polyphosphate kinase 2 (PPK2 family)
MRDEVQPRTALIVGADNIPLKYIVDTGIQLIKFWLEVGNEEQKRRFEARIEDSLRQWKLSPMDLPSRSKWYEYSRARDQMLEATDTEHAILDVERRTPYRPDAR